MLSKLPTHGSTPEWDEQRRFWTCAAGREQQPIINARFIEHFMQLIRRSYFCASEATVNTNQFSPWLRDLNWRRAHCIMDAEVVVTFLGRLVAEKGIPQFAATIDILGRWGCRVRPLIIGPGPAEGTLRALLPDGLFAGLGRNRIGHRFGQQRYPA